MQKISTPPHRFVHRVGMAVCLIGALVLTAFQPISAVHADTGFAYYWSLTFDFESSLNGTLHVVVGYNDEGAPQEPPIYAENSIVACQRVGNVTLSGGLLKLNGGYLRCELDVHSALERAFEVCDRKVAGCQMEIEKDELYAHFRAMTDVLSTNPGIAPIFYHPNASYAIDVQSSTAKITGSLSPHGVIPATPAIVFPALGVMQSYEAFYSCEGGCDVDYGVGAMQETVATANALIPFYTPTTTVYIGYNPITGLVAPVGTHIDSIVVDPPNHGND